MSSCKELGKLVLFVYQEKLSHCQQNIDRGTNTDEIDWIDVRQTQHASLDIDSNFVDGFEVPRERIERLNGHINKEQHSQQVKQSIDGDDLKVVVKRSLDADTREKYQAESEDVPQKLKVVFLCQNCFVVLGFIVVITESNGLLYFLNFELFLLFLFRAVLGFRLFLRTVLFFFIIIGKIEVGMSN